MKLLIMCEGSNELAVVNMLLNNGRFVFTEDDLLNLVPYHARQISTSVVIKNALNIYPNNDVKVLRIGDKQSDTLKIPKEYKEKVVAVEKYCTKPELEILLIIAEGLLADYEKVKSRMSPKTFAKHNVKFNNRRYDNSTKFYEEYFGDDIDLLVAVIKEYRQIKHSHDKDEHYLADLLGDRNK